MTEIKDVYETELIQNVKEDERPTGIMAFDYSNRFLADVKQSNLLPTELEEKIQAMLPELQHSFQTQTIWRTETEIIASVLNDKDFPDDAAKYHQAKLEQKVFFEQLLQLSFEYRKHQKDIELKEVEIEEKEMEVNDYQNRLTNFESTELFNEPLSRNQLEIVIKRGNIELERLKVELEEMLYGIENMKIQGRERTRELEIWSKIKSDLDDGSFDIDNRDTNQLLSFTRSYVKKAFLAVSSGEGGDVSGYANIIAQFESGIKLCMQRNLFDEMIKTLTLDELKFVNNYFPALDIRDGNGKSINDITSL